MLPMSVKFTGRPVRGHTGAGAPVVVVGGAVVEETVDVVVGAVVVVVVAGVAVVVVTALELPLHAEMANGITAAMSTSFVGFKKFPNCGAQKAAPWGAMRRSRYLHLSQRSDPFL